MSHCPAEIISQALIDLGLGQESSDEWQVFVSFLPNAPDEAICVYDTPGKFDGRIMRSGDQVEHPGIQVRVRGKDYAQTWSKVNAIALALDTQAAGLEIALSSDSFYALDNVSRSGPIIPLGIETEGDRRWFHFTINAMLTVRQLVT